MMPEITACLISEKTSSLLGEGKQIFQYTKSVLSFHCRSYFYYWPKISSCCQRNVRSPV